MGSVAAARRLGFYLPMVMSAGAVLDVGCGTGELLRLARQAGHHQPGNHHHRRKGNRPRRPATARLMPGR
jgi:hypothetical protein